MTETREIETDSKHLRVSVDEEAWRRAQLWELKNWQKQNYIFFKIAIKLRYMIRFYMGKRHPKPGDDWNYWWAEQFENYQVLPKKVSRAIELGSGPYTNLRLILKTTEIDSVICSDPLAEYYIK